MLVHTGPGKYRITRDTDHTFAVCLYNFDIDGTQVKDGHTGILKGRIMAFLRSGGSASILGVASTTSNRNWDLELSRKRAEAVTAFLRLQWMFTPSDPFNNGPLRIQKVEWQGKDLPLQLGVKDNLEAEIWRSVWIHAWDNMAPPPASTVVGDMGLPEVPNQSMLPSIGMGLDIASWISGLTLAELIPVLDMAISIIDILAALPVAWAAADNAAYINGYILGYNNAMQDMADAFSDPSLTRKPQSAWPAIPHPTPHWANQATDIAGQQKWKQGEQDGCEKAYQEVMAKETSPKTMTVRKGGETRNVPMTGKLFLRILSRGLKDQVAAFFMLKWNEWLRSKGKKPWPTTG